MELLCTQKYVMNDKTTFVLHTWDTNKVVGNKWVIHFQFIKLGPVFETIIFEDDIHCPSIYAIDSDYTLQAILGFITLRLGDTDREYFKDYTKVQIEFRDTYAEELQLEFTGR